MRHRETFDVPPFADDVDRAPVGDGRDREAGDGGQRRFVIERSREHLSGLAQERGALRRSLRLRHVARDLRRADDAAGRVPDRRHCQRDYGPRPVLAAAHGLEVVDDFTASDPVQDLVFFALPIRGNDDSDGLSDDFFGGVAEQPFGAAIPRRDPARDILADDGVVARFDDGGQQAAVPFVPSLLCDVARDFRDAGDGAGAIANRRCRQRDVEQRAVAPPADGFVVLDAFTAADAPNDLGFLGLLLRRHDHRQRLADCRRRRKAEQTLGSLIPRGDRSVEVDAVDRRFGGIDDRREPEQRRVERFLRHAPLSRSKCSANRAPFDTL